MIRHPFAALIAILVSGTTNCIWLSSSGGVVFASATPLYCKQDCFISLRGGHLEDEYDEYDDFDEESLADDVPSMEYDHNLIEPPSERVRKSSPSSSRRRRPVAKKPTSHWTQRMASSSLKMTSQIAWGAVQQTGKVAYQLVKPRHVDAREVAGLWRLDQSVVTSGGSDLASVATVELDPRKRIVILKLPDGTTVIKPFTFSKTRLGSWKTEFVTPAFLVGDSPRLYGYRGTWQRKLADKRVIKLVGKIYSVRKQRFGKEKGKYLFAQPVGSFVARRRMKLAADDGNDDIEGEDESYVDDDDVLENGEEDIEEGEYDFESDASDAYDDQESEGNMV